MGSLINSTAAQILRRSKSANLPLHSGLRPSPSNAQVKSRKCKSRFTICEGFDFETQDFEALGCLLLERTAGDCRVAHATPQQSTGSLLRHGFFLPDGLRYAIDEL